METKKSKDKRYSNGEVTVVWKQELCIHSAKCVHGLPAVFRAEEKPWINPLGATTAEIIHQVKKCPSGALSVVMDDGSDPVELISEERNIEIFKNGPLMVEGNISIKDAEGNIVKRHKRTFFCRCGASKNKPFCDGAHKKIGFEG